MASPGVQGQWAVDQSAQGAFSVLRGFLKAASSDNVQPHALYVCQKFGNTLAISSQTIRKVETVLLPTPSPAPVAFLNASVGFSRNDCATELGNTLSGQRFLALAASLVTSVGALDGAKAISIMIEASRREESQEFLTPSTRNLTDILQSLVPRSVHCGFRDIMVTWEVLIRQTVFQHIFGSNEHTGPIPEPPHTSELKNHILKAIPPPESIAGIVDAFRQVARLGETTVTGLTIKVEAGAAWVLAFAQWCLDIPPSLFVDNINILHPPGSRVKVVISIAPSNKSIEVIIHHHLESLCILLQPAAQFSSHGLVNFESYWKWLLSETGFDSEPGRRLLSQVFEYAIPQLLPNMASGGFGRLGRNSNLVVNFVANDPLDSCRPYLLPDIRNIADLCGLILGRGTQRLTMLPEGLLIQDLPLVKLQLEHLRRTCECRECNTMNADDDNDCLPRARRCLSQCLMNDISSIITNLFALSLFECPESVMIRPSHERHRGNGMRNTICALLKTGAQQIYADHDLIDWARAMVGHTFEDENRGLIVTSSRGQVVYAALFDAHHFERIGYVRLLCFCGKLKYDGDTYDFVGSSYDDAARTRDSSDSDESDMSDAYEQTTTEPDIEAAPLQPSNLYANAVISWEITIQEGRYIEANLRLRLPNSNFATTTNPELGIQGMADVLIYENCSHNGRMPLPDNTFSAIEPPWYDVGTETPDITSLVRLVAVDGSHALRYFALASHQAPAVLRRHACLSCCLTLCRENNISLLIL